MVKPAQTKLTFNQKGIVDPKIIIGGVIALVVVFFIATGNFKFSASVDKSVNEDTDKSAVQENQQQPVPDIETKPKTYQSAEHGIALEYPATWSLKENPNQQFVAVFRSPKESSSDNFMDFLAIKVIDISSNPDYTLQEIADLWENQTRDESEEEQFNVVDRISTNLAGEETRDILYTAKVDEGNGQGLVRIVLKNNKAYIFQYNAMADSYDKFLPDVEAILSTVRI